MSILACTREKLTVQLCRTETCAFSGFRIYPGHGMTYIRVDGKVGPPCP
jgi:hypothetical protein